MIGKIIIGKSFRGCILYCLNDKIQVHPIEKVIKNRAEVLMFNQCYGNQKELIQQFNEVRKSNPKLSKPVMHITLSMAPGENLSKDKLMEMVQHCAMDMGFTNNQYLAVYHNDTNHQHLHIVANRVGYDKLTVSDSNSYQKIANFCRKMEMKYNLKQVLSPKRYQSREQRLIPRHDQRKGQIKEHIRQAISKSRHYHEFEQRMKEKGYQVIKGRGISFIDEKKVKVKGSELNYSLQTIERMLERNRVNQLPETFRIQNQNRDLPAARVPRHDVNPSPLGNGQNGIFNTKQNPSLLNNLTQEATKMMEDLMKPAESIDQFAEDLLKKKKRKKRLRQSGH